MKKTRLYRRFVQVSKTFVVFRSNAALPQIYRDMYLLSNLGRIMVKAVKGQRRYNCFLNHPSTKMIILYAIYSTLLVFKNSWLFLLSRKSSQSVDIFRAHERQTVDNTHSKLQSKLTVSNCRRSPPSGFVFKLRLGIYCPCLLQVQDWLNIIKDDFHEYSSSVFVFSFISSLILSATLHFRINKGFCSVAVMRKKRNRLQIDSTEL